MTPADMSKYPDNWESEIRPSILRRAGGQEDNPAIGAKCEICGVTNYAVGRRDESGNFVPSPLYQFFDFAEWTSSSKKAGEFQKKNKSYPGTSYKWIRIILTVAHWYDPNPMSCDQKNLKAACQKCHNDRDKTMRYHNAKRTRKLKEKGMLL